MKWLLLAWLSACATATPRAIERRLPAGECELIVPAEGHALWRCEGTP